MGVLNRLFRRDRKAEAPDESERAVALAALADGLGSEPPSGAHPVQQPAAAAIDTEPAPPGAEPEQPEIPLRSLQRYRQDPAFKNFMTKAQKKPGAANRRPGIPSEYFDGEQRPR